MAVKKNSLRLAADCAIHERFGCAVSYLAKSQHDIVYSYHAIASRFANSMYKGLFKAGC